MTSLFKKHSMIKRIELTILVFILVIGWFFRGCLLIFDFPIKIQKAQAATHAYNFQGVINSNHGQNGNPIAIEHDSDVFPWTSSGQQNDSAYPSDTEYVNISANNTLEWTTDDPGRNDEMAITYRFFIQESISTISNVEITWNGNTDGSRPSNHSIWLRKDGFDQFGGTNTWVQLGSSLSIPPDTDTDLIGNLTSDFSTYINASTGQFEFVITEDRSSEDMRTNYVQVAVTYTSIPEAPTFYNTGGTEQLSFNNIKQSTTIPRFRVSAIHTADFNRFQIELNDQVDFTGTSYSQTFSGIYLPGTEYNLLCDNLLPSLSATDGVTYYVRARASADGGTNWGRWSYGTWSFTYNATEENPIWWQVTDEQFNTGVLTSTETYGSDQVRLVPGSIHAYNFQGVTNSNHGQNGNPIAIEHDSDVFPWTSSGQQNDSAYPSDTEYVNISANNTLEWATDDPGRNDEMAITYRFFIQESISTISNVEITWNGNTDGSRPSNHSIWLRKDGFDQFGGTNTWVQLGSSLSIPPDTDTDLIGNLTSDFSTYINASTGQFEFVITEDRSSEDMRTNYVQVKVAITDATSGTIMSPAIDFDSFVGTNYSWGQASWSEDETSGRVSMQVYRQGIQDCDTLVSDSLIPGNSAGIAASPIDLTDLDELDTTHNRLCLKATLVDSGGTPYLQNWQINWQSIIAQAKINQLHFRWRDDSTDLNSDGGWLAAEDSNSIGEISKNTTYRLRIESANTGDLVEDFAKTYQLQWGEKTGVSCNSILTWTGLNDAVDEFTMVATDYINPDGESTSPGLLSNSEGHAYLGGEGRESADTTDLIGPLSVNEYTELEYSIEATDNAVSEATYCFRLYDTTAGAALDIYSVYPEVTMAFERNTDFFIQRGSLQVSGTSATITAGVDYEVPSALSRAFIRLTNTQITGAGDDIGGGSQNADDVTIYISNPENLLTSITFTRPSTAISNTRVSWEIIEYIGPAGGANEIMVRNQGVVTYGSSDTTVSSALVLGVTDDNDLVPFITGQMNPDTGRNDYNTTLSTATWNKANNEIDFTRGEAGNDAVKVSWAAVEFIGSNWQIQRVEHTYSAAGVIETETIIPVNDLSRAFLHVQKQVGTGLRGLDEFGHEVWLSAIDTVSFQLQNGAGTPSDHTSVVWVIENIQINGIPMVVTRSNGTQSGGSEPSTVNIDIGKTIDDLGIASIFTNNRVLGTGTAYPRPIMAVEIISSTQYQLWLSDTGQTRAYRTEVVEWPTAIIGAYKTSGTYISSSFNAGAPSVFNIIEWTWSVTNSSCSTCKIKLQIQTASDSGGLPGSWSVTWCGPEGEDGDETDYFTVSTGELIHTDHNDDQWIRYKAKFDGNGAETPVLEEVKINYK